MKNITSFTINDENLPAVASSRQFNVAGEKDAEFILQVFNAPTGPSDAADFYDFNSQSFTGFISTSNLKVKMTSDNYNGNIQFPANASGDTYTILLLTPPDKDTELNFGTGKNSYSTIIQQVVNTTLKFSPVTANSDDYQTFSSTGAADITSTSSPTLISSITKTVDWDLKNTENNSNGFGLRLIRQPIDTDWYFTTQETVNQPVDTGSTTEVVVDDLTDLCTGMYITAGTGLSGTPTITAINIGTKTLTLSAVQNFADGAGLTFQARGSSVIKKAIGADIDFSNWNANVVSAKSAELTKTVRTDAGSTTTIDLYGTYGISGLTGGKGVVTMSGVNVVNTAGNAVQTVSPSSSAGSIVMEIDQTGNGLAQGTKLYFTGSTQTVTIANNIVINSHPSSDKTILLNLDNFITPGVSGA